MGRELNERNSYSFGGSKPKQLNRRTLTQIRELFRHGSVWITAGVITMLIGVGGWYSTSSRDDTVVDGLVTSVELDDSFGNGQSGSTSSQTATIEYQDADGETQRFQITGQGLDEGDTPSVAFDPDDPSNGRFLKPRTATFSIIGGLLGIPIIAFGCFKLIRR